jgi:hypothetical protein
MTHIRIRDLQKISGEAIGALPGPTPVKSGERTVGLLIPLKSADPDRLAAVLKRAEALAKGRDAAADDSALAAFGDVDPVDCGGESPDEQVEGVKRPSTTLVIDAAILVAAVRGRSAGAILKARRGRDPGHDGSCRSGSTAAYRARIEAP